MNRTTFNLTRTLIAAAGLTAAAAIPAAGRAEAVAHGEPVQPGHYRFATKLTMTGIPRPDGSRYDSACSAALVAPRWVVTAGHCFHDPERNPVGGPVPYPTTATVGDADLADGTGEGHVVDVSEVRQAPDRDIALARLARPVLDVRPIGLSRHEPTVGQTVRITGWGATAPGNPPSMHLQTGLMSVTSTTNTVVGVTGQSPERDTSACAYDSGAPYFTESLRGARLVSVESGGPTCPHDQEETTARVDTIVSWIDDILRSRP